MFSIAGRNQVAFRSAKVAQGRSFRGAKGDYMPKLSFPRYSRSDKTELRSAPTVDTSFDSLEVWFVTGSQHLYGEQALARVAVNSQQVVAGLNDSGQLPIRVIFKPVVTTPESITELCRSSSSSSPA